MDNESWVEKFRPNNLSSIISQEEIILSLKNALVNKNIPHLLFLVLLAVEKHLQF